MMSALCEHISYLLTRHDCVVVPGLGAFIAQYQSAVIDHKTGMIIPPSRMLAFNESVSHDDGLLVSSFARKYSIPYPLAKNRVAEEVAKARNIISESGQYEIPGTGVLSRGTDGASFDFTPASAASSSPEFAYLKALPVRKVLDVAAAEAPEENLPRRIIHIRRASSRRAIMPVVMKAAAAIILLAALCVPFMRHNDASAAGKDNISYASMSPSGCGASLSASGITVADDSVSFLPLVALPDNFGTAVADKKFSSDDRYFLIVASLPSMEKAEQFIRESKDSSLRTVESGSRVRVYAASTPTLEKATSIANTQEIKAKYPDRKSVV